MLPRGVIGLLQVEEHGHHMLTAHKCFADERLEPHQLIGGTTLLSKTTLEVRKRVVGFEKPYQTLIDYSFEGLAEAAGQCNWPIVPGVSGNLTRLRYWDNSGFPPARGKTPDSHTSLKILNNVSRASTGRCFRN